MTILKFEISEESLVSEYPRLQYSKRDVIRVGQALKGDIIWDSGREQEIYDIFEIAHNWRTSHAYPMRKMRSQMSGYMRGLDIKGLTAARLKQLSSVREKLRRINSNLRQMQDLGGCRAVVPTMENARSLVDRLKERSPHNFRRENCYMDEPRPSGYRSHHLVFGFAPQKDDEEDFLGRQIEIQVRSRLQHSWATAVEAVGLYRGEDLKAGKGSQEWLRLFELMSAEMARAEGCEYAQDGSNSRLAEIADLSSAIDVVQALDTIRIAADNIERRTFRENRAPKFCLIKYDRENRKVDVSYTNGPSGIHDSYGTLEHDNEREGRQRYSVVMIEVEKIDDLRNAFPNYFGDVQLFKNSLSQVVSNGDIEEYSLPPIERVSKPREVPDDSWLRHPHQRRWE